MKKLLFTCVITLCSIIGLTQARVNYSPNPTVIARSGVLTEATGWCLKTETGTSYSKWIDNKNLICYEKVGETDLEREKCNYYSFETIQSVKISLENNIYYLLIVKKYKRSWSISLIYDVSVITEDEYAKLYSIPQGRGVAIICKRNFEVDKVDFNDDNFTKELRYAIASNYDNYYKRFFPVRVSDEGLIRFNIPMKGDSWTFTDEHNQNYSLDYIRKYYFEVSKGDFNKLIIVENGSSVGDENNEGANAKVINGSSDTMGKIYNIVEEMPKFNGGSEKMYDYIYGNLHYPMEAQKKDIQGVVCVQFVVEPNGAVSEPVVLRGIGGGCDEEALRIVKSMPKWVPGKHNGELVRVSTTVNVVFKLQ